jgi:hypothetical protein
MLVGLAVSWFPYLVGHESCSKGVAPLAVWLPYKKLVLIAMKDYYAETMKAGEK